MPAKSGGVQDDMLLPFFGLTFAITWGLAAILVLFPEPMEALFGPLSIYSPVFILAVAGPTIAATILTFAREGWPGLRALYGRLLRWRFGIRWYALVLGGIPLIGYVVSQVAGPEPQYDLSTPALIVSLLFTLLITGPLGEEIGWRGFALPRLLKRFTPFMASLVLGILWGVWHLPSFFLSGTPQTGLALPIFMFAAVCLAFVATWLFRHTGQSVLIIVLYHFMVNFSLSVLGTPLPALTVAIAVAAVLVVVLDRGFGWFHRDELARE